MTQLTLRRELERVVSRIFRTFVSVVASVWYQATAIFFSDSIYFIKSILIYRITAILSQFNVSQRNLFPKKLQCKYDQTCSRGLQIGIELLTTDMSN